MSPPDRPSISRRVAETCIGTFLIIISTLEIEDYTGVKDKYPMACNIANALKSTLAQRIAQWAARAYRER
ncbi:hypothetical protein N7463_009750 [Penicillium fimorum]|uniref:Uncharacterized protein n=1 Tax=Penicillium fimorum TaxID=1882269 RepID=A0A9W9XIW2_9EURO|nr:hypothetical protein N7463_009750 [Penicillium fimorum]